MAALVYACAIILVMMALYFIRTRMLFDFPLPWPDEAAFVSQGFALYHTGSLFVPALNPDRLVMWMPPGYMLALAAVFHAFGYSFGLARGLSTACFGAASCLTFYLAYTSLRGWMRFAVVPAILACLLTPYVIVIANVARMEAVFFLLAMLSLACTVNRRPLIGLAIVIVMSIVHFNAVYFLLPFLPLVGFSLWRLRLPHHDRLDRAALGAATACVAGYGIFIACHWQGFVTDMAFQRAVKATLPFHDIQNRLLAGVVIGAVAARAAAAARAVDTPVILALFACSFYLMALVGREDWYEFAISIACLLALIAGLALPQQAAGGIAGRAASHVLPCLAACGLLYFMTGKTPATAPITVLASRPLFPWADLNRVHAFLRTLPPGTRVSFAENFAGIEPFFFADLAESGAIWTLHNHNVIARFPLRDADWRVQCDSALYPPYFVHNPDDAYPRRGADTGCKLIPLPPAGRS
jgi:hypothetical protein